MVLLFKKGDPLQLKNWRLLSLINTDAKLFTKLLTNQLKTLANRIINPYQSGFLPKRLISDNDWVTNTLMAHMKSVAPQLPMVSVLLDQEKAYDRVHPKYLELTLLRFGFPSTFVQTINSLFFNTRVSISINGWLAPAFQQKRGLRQGDPLSPILFNIAFEPLLPYILGKPMLRGIQLPEVQTTKRHWPTIIEKSVDDMQPLKLLSYADDLQVFLNDTKEWKILLHILDLYGKASNAKVNLSKTMVISMSGKTHTEWTEILQRESIKWHDKTDQHPIVQLGYPFYSSPQQLQSFLDQLEIKMVRHNNILKGRNLSIRGSSTVTNALLMSKLRHVMRVIPVPATWIKKDQVTHKPVSHTLLASPIVVYNVPAEKTRRHKFDQHNRPTVCTSSGIPTETFENK